MKYRLDITPEAINAGSLIYDETYRVTAVNRTPLDVELRYDGLLTTGGVFHTPPALPLDIPPGVTHPFNVTVTTNGPLKIDGTLQLDFHFDVDSIVAAKAGFGPMIYNGLIVNAYHPEIGRGGYFHENSGTSEGQGVMILACFLAYEALRDNPADAEVAEYYRSLAIDMLAAMAEFDNNGPMLRQPIPDNPETITLLHWLFAAKGPVQLQNVVLDRVVTLTGGTTTVPASAMGDGVVTVYKLYPASSQLLYSSPFSPVIGGGEVAVSSFTENPDGSLTVNASAADGSYKLVYSYYSPQTLPLGSAYEAYPVWTAVPDGYAACAPDTFRWFDMALNKAIELGVPRDASKWLKLRDALRRTVVKGQNLTDLREVIKPLPRLGVFATSGMFCYSDNPNALVPAAGSGLEAGWVGYNFWSRDPLTGNIIGEVPLASGNPAATGVSSSQIGRGFEDTWRTTTPYQEADQFLLVEMGVRQNQNISAASSGGSPNFRPYISTTREYSVATRYYAPADSASMGGAWAWDDNSQMRTLLFPRSAFKNEAGATFPAGGQILNFGMDLSAPVTVGYTVSLREMRLVSGPSAAWVMSNLSLARKGSKLPYFPGSIPFATNADLNAQEFVGYNGNPFHGYQLPDLWLHLAKEAALEHPVLTSNDLPTTNPETQEIRFPISLQNVNGSAKPAHIALMEQQLLFLRDAADVFFRDHAIRGPFAHTFVLNTPARYNIGGPAPHTWVYTNDDPNTRWAGYQVRVVESLAEVVKRTAGLEYAEDAFTLAKTQAVNWLVWLNAAWPNLSGSPYKGMPTDFPAVGAPQTNYEEVHSPAIIIRACVYMKLGTTDQNALCDAVMQRCWDYLELFWNTTGEMAYTWSPLPADRWWYGFWHAEIIWTLSLLLGEGSTVVPAGIPLATVRARLLQTQQWLDTKGVLDARQRVEVPVNGFRAEMVGVDPNWRNSYRVSRAYKTDVFTSASGESQRRALRETPRKTIEFTNQFVGQDLKDFQTTLSVWQNRDFMAPELTRFERITSAVEAGSSFVDLAVVPDWLMAGGLVALVDGGRGEPYAVDSISDGRIYFTGPLLSSWPEGSRLCHAAAGRLSASFNMPRQSSQVSQCLLALDVHPGSEQYPVLFEVPTDTIFPGLTEGPDMYPLTNVPVNAPRVYYHDGEEIFLLRNNWGESVTEGRQWPVYANDFDTGVVEYESDIEFGTRVFSGTILCETPERRRYMQGFFDRMRGAQGNFWMPTWENDLPLAGDVIGEASTLRVTASRTARLLLGNAVYREIAVVTHTRQLYTNSILDVEMQGSVAVLTVRDPWPDNLALDDVLMVCWMPAWRLSSDEQAEQWLSSSVGQVVLECRTDRAERYDPEDVAALRRAVIYSSRPYPLTVYEGLSSRPSLPGARLSPNPVIQESLEASASVTSASLRDTLRVYTAPAEALEAASVMISDATLRNTLLGYTGPTEGILAVTSLSDGSLQVKLKEQILPTEALAAVPAVTGGSLDAG